MSDGGEGVASLGVKVLYPSQKLSTPRPPFAASLRWHV